MMKSRFLGCAIVVALLLLNSEHSFALDKKQHLFVGVEGGKNAGVVTTEPQHLGGATKAIGFTIDDASATPVSDYVEVFVGIGAGTNAGVVSPDDDHAGGATQSIGYLSIKPIAHGTKINVGKGACNAGVATTDNKHLSCDTKFLGYSLPE